METGLFLCNELKIGNLVQFEGRSLRIDGSCTEGEGAEKVVKRRDRGCADWLRR